MLCGKLSLYKKRELKEEVHRLLCTKNGRTKLKRKGAPVIVERGKSVPH